MNLKIRLGTVRYNNKILVSNEKFSLGKNDKVNAPAMKSHKTNSLGLAHAPGISHKPQTTTHIGQSDEKIALVLALANGSAIQARRKHFGSGEAIGTKKTAGGLGCCKPPIGSRAEPWWGPRGQSPQKLREFGHFKALKLALLQQFRQDFYYKNLKAERHILKD